METAIKVEHLKKYYKEVKAVDDINFQVTKGELFGFLGVNGAGKSTTMNMLCTLQEPTKGRAWINGLELGKENEEIKKHIGVVYQNNCLDKLLTVKENLLFHGSLYEKDRQKLNKNLAYVTEILGLEDVLKRPFGKLSGGQKRKSEIARALMHKPDILFLDEPTTGLDPATRKNVWQTVHFLQKEIGMTVFLTTHYMEEAAKADHIGIMDQGHFVEYGTPFSLKETYAKDKLYLIPKIEKIEEVKSYLIANHLEYSMKKEDIVTNSNSKLSCQRVEGIKNQSVETCIFIVWVDNTLAALPLLQDIKQMIQGFEMIQGTMEDVFLKVTEKESEK